MVLSVECWLFGGWTLAVGCWLLVVGHLIVDQCICGVDYLLLIVYVG